MAEVHTHVLAPKHAPGSAPKFKRTRQQSKCPLRAAWWRAPALRRSRSSTLLGNAARSASRTPASPNMAARCTALPVKRSAEDAWVPLNALSEDGTVPPSATAADAAAASTNAEPQRHFSLFRAVEALSRARSSPLQLPAADARKWWLHKSSGWTLVSQRSLHLHWPPRINDSTPGILPVSTHSTNSTTNVASLQLAWLLEARSSRFRSAHESR